MSERAARSEKNQPPPIDPAIQNKLIAKFGAKIMKRGFTALPDLVQDYFRYVPGNPYVVEVIDTETGEIRQIERIAHMTPTEYVVMTAIWSYWWSNQSNPWPSVEHIREKVDKSERQVRRYLQRLRDKGFMLSLEQYNGEGKQISNRYDFTPFLKRLVAYLDALELREKPVQDIARDDKNTEQWMSDQPGSGCQNDQGKQIENEANTSNKDESSSSGSAASPRGTILPPSPPESLSPGKAIRNSKEGTEENQHDGANRTSNRPLASEEMSAAACVEDVIEDRKEKTGGKFETTREKGAAAAGIPREHLERLELGGRKRPDVPFFIEACLGDVSRQLNDANPNSSISQAHNVCTFYASQVEDFGEEAFRKHLYIAVKRANHLSNEEVTVRHNGMANRMPAFFRAFRASLRREYGIEPLAGERAEKSASPASETVVEASVVSDELEVLPTQNEARSRPTKPERTNAQKEARERYATHVRSQLRNHGVVGSFEMMIDREHLCGCPLVDKNWKCVRCYPDRKWEQDVLALIDTILEH